MPVLSRKLDNTGGRRGIIGDVRMQPTDPEFQKAQRDALKVIFSAAGAARLVGIPPEVIRQALEAGMADVQDNALTIVFTERVAAQPPDWDLMLPDAA